MDIITLAPPVQSYPSGEAYRSDPRGESIESNAITAPPPPPDRSKSVRSVCWAGGPVDATVPHSWVVCEIGKGWSENAPSLIMEGNKRERDPVRQWGVYAKERLYRNSR